MMGKSTRDTLIEIGRQLMRQNGYYSIGIKDILDSAQVPKGSFYHYCESKEEFTYAVLKRYADRELKQRQGILDDENVATLKRLRQDFEKLIKVYGQQGPILDVSWAA
jgi:TetR/AcrR family transcriptional repressor of nem operon